MTSVTFAPMRQSASGSSALARLLRGRRIRLCANSAANSSARAKPWCFIATRVTGKPARRAASAVTGPTAAMRRAAKEFITSTPSDCERSTNARTAFALVSKSQSKVRSSRSALSRGAKSWGGWKEIIGWSTGLAPRASSSRTSDSVCSDARVMRIFLPASGDAEASTMLAPDFFEDGLRAGLEEQASDVFAESGGLLGRCGGALANILSAVDGTDAGFEDEFTAFRARPGAEGHLAAT